MDKLVLFDVDGPIFDQEWFQLRSKVQKYVKEKYGYNVVNENGNKFTDIYGCSEKEQIKIWTKFILEYSLFYEPKPWIIELINALKEKNIKVGLLTAKPKITEEGIEGKILKILFEMGLKSHGIEPDFIKYVSLKNSAKEKAEYVKNIKADLVVEDTTENIVEIAKVAPVIVQNVKSNLDSNFESKNIKRVSSIDEMYVSICQILDINFQNFNFKSKKEIDEMTISEKKEYYKNLVEVMQQMPFNHKTIKKQEKHQTNLSNILKNTYGNINNITVNGLHNIPNEPCIFISNHVRFEDHYLIASTIGSNYHTLFKKEIKDSVISKLLDYIGTIYVERGYKISSKASIHEMLKYLANGHNILLFPEGTYRREDYPLKEFSDGAFILSQITGYPIVPIVLNYYENAKIVDILSPYYINTEEENIAINKNNIRMRMAKKILDNDSLNKGEKC